MKKIETLILLLLGINGVFAQFPKYLYGIASWYGEEYRGKKTASGELFNPDAMTAAHRSLPFGTQVEVENLENGKKVIVIINDRGPFVENRILDLSKAAAEQLNFLKKGTAYVKVVILRLGNDEVEQNNEGVESTEEARKKAAIASKSSSLSASSSSSKSSSVSSVNTNSSSSSSSSSSQATEVTQTNIIHVVIPETNKIFITNTVIRFVTNAPIPYQEKLVEKGLPEPVDSNLIVNLESGFLEEEPVLNDENTVVDVLMNPEQASASSSSSAPVTNQIVNFDNEIVKEQSDTNQNTKDFEDLIGFLTDENNTVSLFSNDTAMKVEEIHLSNELSGELKGNSSSINSEEIDTNRRITFEEPSEDEIEIDFPEDIVSNTFSRSEPNKTPPPSPGLNYVVQVGAFVKEGNALNLYDFLKNKKMDVFTTETVIKGKRYIRVRLGYYDSQEKAKKVLRQVQRLHLPGMIVKIKVKN